VQRMYGTYAGMDSDLSRDEIENFFGGLVG
jgi:hypothetical protein